MDANANRDDVARKAAAELKDYRANRKPQLFADVHKALAAVDPHTTRCSNCSSKLFSRDAAQGASDDSLVCAACGAPAPDIVPAEQVID